MKITGKVRGGFSRNLSILNSLFEKAKRAQKKAVASSSWQAAVWIARGTQSTILCIEGKSNSSIELILYNKRSHKF